MLGPSLTDDKKITDADMSRGNRIAAIFTLRSQVFAVVGRRR